MRRKESNQTNKQNLWIVSTIQNLMNHFDIRDIFYLTKAHQSMNALNTYRVNDPKGGMKTMSLEKIKFTCISKFLNYNGFDRPVTFSKQTFDESLDFLNHSKSHESF